MAEQGNSDGGRRRKGFEQAASLVRGQIRGAGESRGFAVSKVLTHWDEIVGTEFAASARPVKVSYGASGGARRKHGDEPVDHGLGATLTVLTTGAMAPMLEMQKESLRQKVNACYGYNAIARIRITQTAPEGFSEARALFRGQKRPASRADDPEVVLGAREVTEGVRDSTLRAALESLGRTVLSRRGT